jgi:RNA polymerase sigma-70 factor (ECF subfamily)
VADPSYGNATSQLYPAETRLAVEKALDRLTADQREAIVLKIYQGFKFEEMAAILDAPVSTVKSRVYAAMETLKELLAPVGANS